MGKTTYIDFASTLLSKSVPGKPHIVVVEGSEEPYKLILLRTVLIKSVRSFLRVVVFALLQREMSGEDARWLKSFDLCIP